MILELTQAKFGEKLSWIKVTNGTFWPPHGLVTAIMRHENCTSGNFFGQYFASNIFFLAKILLKRRSN